MDVSKLIKEIEDTAREAGRIMLDAENIRRVATTKQGHGNFVTEFDKQVQKYLFSALSKILPEASFIGEEDDSNSANGQSWVGYTFCVDPIDGTSNFLTGYRPSVTSIALLRDGRPYIGVVYNPYSDMMFSALRGGGAYLNGSQISSSTEPLAQSLVVFGTTPYNLEFAEETFKLCARYLPRCIDLRRSGSSAWDLCSVAMGTVGLFFELRLSLWDYAAAGLIAMEAGCTLTRVDGSAIPWNGPSSVLCASAGVACEGYLPLV